LVDWGSSTDNIYHEILGGGKLLTAEIILDDEKMPGFIQAMQKEEKQFNQLIYTIKVGSRGIEDEQVLPRKVLLTKFAIVFLTNDLQV
jgi:hypothetical protein